MAESELERIVRALAEADPMSDYDPSCFACFAQEIDDEREGPFVHRDGCVWLAARVWVDAHPFPG